MAKKLQHKKTIRNKYLGAVKTIKAPSYFELEHKVETQKKKWKAKEEVLRKKDLATQRTEEARQLVRKYQNLLDLSLSSPSRFEWEHFKRTGDYEQFTLVEPDKSEVYRNFEVPKESLFEMVFGWLRMGRLQKEEAANREFERKLKSYSEAYELYQLQKSEYESNQECFNNDIETWRKAYSQGEPQAIERLVNYILQESKFPDGRSLDFEIQYRDNEQTLIIAYKLPTPDELPRIKEYRYVKSRDEVVEKHMAIKEFERFYDSVIHQVVLRSINKIFTISSPVHVKYVSFNGWVDYVDKATGKDSSSCVISVHVSRDTFEDIVLKRVDHKECIRSLKGIYAGKLVNLSPVTPIQDIDTTDRRFVESKEIMKQLHSMDNLAEMDWEDFEHLVRQLFGQMFENRGGKVKVTQSSRDGGVDAVAFDPDPIWGGKHIIQAKRYNIVVPVAAVRELYGTMHHERASKGILVTTSSFGGDSYDWAKGKPITLIDGQKLLGLFNQYSDANVQIVLRK